MVLTVELQALRAHPLRLFSIVCWIRWSKWSKRILSETRESEDSNEEACRPDPFGKLLNFFKYTVATSLLHSNCDIFCFRDRLYKIHIFWRATSKIQVSNGQYHFLPRTFWSIWSVPPMWALCYATTLGRGTIIFFFCCCEYLLSWPIYWVPHELDTIVTTELSIHLTYNWLSVFSMSVSKYLRSF